MNTFHEKKKERRKITTPDNVHFMEISIFKTAFFRAEALEGDELLNRGHKKAPGT